MSNIREKAREIKAAGEAERGNFTPTGVPKRMYNYWLDNSNSRKAGRIQRGMERENFCHFWRVVAIWAPLMFLGRGIVKVVEHPVTLPLFGTLFVITALTLLIWSGAWLGLLFAIGLGLAIFIAAAAIVLGVIYVKDNWWTRGATRFTKKVFAFVSLTALAAFVVFGLTMATLEIGLVFWVYLVSAAAILAGAVFALEKLSTYISGRRALARAEREAAYERYLSGEGPNPNEREPREPGRIDKFFSGLGDFLILIFQVVRVNKWKICPMVEVDRESA